MLLRRGQDPSSLEVLRGEQESGERVFSKRVNDPEESEARKKNLNPISEQADS